MTDQNEHDCSKCNKVPAQIEITGSAKERMYHGTLQLAEASFAYSLGFKGDLSEVKKPEDVIKYVEFKVTDADGKAMTLDEDISHYFMTVVSSAAAQFELEAQMTRAVAGGLEQMFGGKVEIPTEGNYKSCLPASDDVKKFLQEYKARGQKA